MAEVHVQEEEKGAATELTITSPPKADASTRTKDAISTTAEEDKTASKCSCIDARTFRFSINDRKPFTNQVSGRKSRKFTDPVCLLLLFLVIIVDLALFGESFSVYDGAQPKYLLHGFDFNDNQCDGDTPFTAWFDVTYPNITRCVTSCDDINSYDAVPFERRWCAPNPDNKQYTHLYDSEADSFFFDEAAATYARTIADLWTEREAVITLCLASILTSCLYLVMICINRRLLAYIVMNVLFGIAGGVLLLIHGIADLKSELTKQSGAFEVCEAVVLLSVASVVSFYLFAKRHALRIKIELMSEAIEAIFKLYSMLIFVVFFAVFIVGFYAYWIAAALYMYSVVDKSYGEMPTELQTTFPDEIGNSTSSYVVVQQTPYGYTMIFHCLFAIYMGFVFCYIGYLVISHSVLTWCLSGEDGAAKCCCCGGAKGGDVGEDKQGVILCHAFGTVCKYHVGTASFAALMSSWGIPHFWGIIGRFYKWTCLQCRDKREQHRKTSVSELKKKVEGLHAVKSNGQKSDDNDEEEVKEEKNENEFQLQGHEQEDNEYTAMYQDIKKKIFPLIRQRVANLVYEHTVSMMVNKKMDTILDAHYESHGGGGDEDDEKADGQMASLDEIQQDIRENMNFEDHEDLKEQIEKFIHKEFDKRDKQKKRSGDDEDDACLTPRGPSRSKKEVATFDSNKISKEGLVFTALYGTSFAFSSYESERLKQENKTRLNASGHMDYNEFFGRVGIATMNTALIVIWMFIVDRSTDDISSFSLPVFVVFIVSYTVGYVFTMVLEATVNSLIFCVILNEDKWNKKFPINQGKIKQNVSNLGHGLSAMLAEHLLIMQLKEKEVNDEINKHDDKNERKKLFAAKRKALATERALLESIDGPMKLTEYLINVILVENYFNSKYKSQKVFQEEARARWQCKNKNCNFINDGDVAQCVGCAAPPDAQNRNSRDELIRRYSHKNWDKTVVKEMMKNEVKNYQPRRVENFMSYFPVKDEKKLENAWKREIKSVVQRLFDQGLAFKLSGATQKGIERAFYKAFYAYSKEKDSGYLYLTDILRCSFVFDDFENLYRCFAEIVDMKDKFKILRVKDRFNKASEPYGYRDLMINVMCYPSAENQEIGGMICEIQLHHALFYNAKKVSHTMYKRTRLFERENGKNEAYEFAKKYVRPVIGRFKVHQMDDDKHGDIMKFIEPQIKKLADDYYARTFGAGR